MAKFSNPFVLLLAFVVLVIIGYLIQDWLKDRRIRKVVAKCMAEHKAWRETQVECPNCLYGKTWRPEVMAANVDDIDFDEPLLTDCQKCNGSGLLPRKNLC
jgi:hypothetical protein